MRLNSIIPWLQTSLSRGVADTPIRRWCRLILEPDGVGSEEKSNETRLVVILGCAAALRSRAGDVVGLAEDVVGALDTDDGPVKRVEEFRARISAGGVFADNAVGAL